MKIGFIVRLLSYLRERNPPLQNDNGFLSSSYLKGTHHHCKMKIVCVSSSDLKVHGNEWKGLDFYLRFYMSSMQTATNIVFQEGYGVVASEKNILFSATT